MKNKKIENKLKKKQKTNLLCFIKRSYNAKDLQNNN